VIRVPQYFNATMTGAVTASPWDGNSGGIVALDVAGTLTFANHTIDVSGAGFHGGVGRSVFSAFGLYSPTDYVRENETSGGQKGEGIAGDPQPSQDTDGYPTVTWIAERQEMQVVAPTG
jgi:hypothetical protein